MFALGCIQALKCNTNKCPTGITTQDRELVNGIVVPDKAERVYQVSLSHDRITIKLPTCPDDSTLSRTLTLTLTPTWALVPQENGVDSV